MADDKSTDDVKDDLITDIGLDDDDTSKPAPSTDEPKKVEGKETKEAKVEAKADTKEPEAPAETDTEGEPAKPDEAKAEPTDETETEKPTKGDQRKDQLNTEIRDLVARRNILKEEVQRANSEVYQPASEADLIEATNPKTGETYTALEAQVEAMRQDREVEKYNAQVADTQLTIESESQRVLTDFPQFNPDSETYDKELAEEASELLAASLILDPNTNQVIGSNVSPYQLYKTLARASGTAAVKGEIKGQQNTEKMLANADAPGSTTKPPETKDPTMAIFTDEWDSP